VHEKKKADEGIEREATPDSNKSSHNDLLIAQKMVENAEKVKSILKNNNVSDYEAISYVILMLGAIKKYMPEKYNAILRAVDVFIWLSEVGKSE